jgi:hypothetical protein
MHKNKEALFMIIFLLNAPVYNKSKISFNDLIFKHVIEWWLLPIIKIEKDSTNLWLRFRIIFHFL